jgi:pimeloyl-ACP methyl ester carboxylesterase
MAMLVSQGPAAAESVDAPQLRVATRAFRVHISGSGRPMILIPDFAGSRSVWASTVAHFQGHHQMHVLTLAGFGGGPALLAPLLENLRRELARYIEENRLDHPVVVGHGFGGLLAYVLAAGSPELVGPVVAIDALPFRHNPFDPSGTTEVSVAQADKMRDLFSMSPLELAIAMRLYLGQSMRNPDELEGIAQNILRTTPTAVGQAVFEMMTTDLGAVMSRVKAPTLLVAAGGTGLDEGGIAKLFVRSENRFRHIARHRITFANNARHFIMLDDPEFLFSEMDSFLSEAEKSR